MPAPLPAEALATLFIEARTPRGWTDKPVDSGLLRAVYDLAKLPPTASNTSPARFVWLVSAEGKARLAALASEGNRARIVAAPATVIIGYDLLFYSRADILSPRSAERMKARFSADPSKAAETAFRNGSLQGAYLMMAARALGLDCWPMSGFDNEGVDAAFFADTAVKSNFICGLGYGDPAALSPRRPRLDFEEAGRFA